MGTARRAFDDVVLAGEGFLLRRPVLSDVDRIVAACTDEQTQRWLPLPRPYGPAEATGFVQTFAAEALRTGTGLVSALEVNGQLAGMVDLNSADWRNQTVAIGYWISPDVRGQGLAGRAAALLARWALTEQDMERVEIRTATGNGASESVARAAGFAREGVLRSAGFTHQGRVDLVVHGLTRADLTGPQASAD
ncbi:GNAT family N-acetyltransferase [Ornithinimicrobium faecis]|uniref:GNAT family N-acetyltransferase n=1 Tax=Ornithinimicrobium faecis TaxID=2934158 RepID=A0ABY4YYJ7_9MICO|nr:GNAT family protein [Ornithinimicrobium sp. HY1793]USQ81832.1 GNAT family N-acetyltransferase [Ornithinimicrobium sp. HY1793]